MNDAEKMVREARQRAVTCYKCGDVGHGVRNCPHKALAAIEINTMKRDEIDDAADEAAMHIAHYAILATDYALFAPCWILLTTWDC